MTFQIATFIITTLLAANQWASFDHPIEPAELVLYSSNGQLDDIFIEVPYLDLLAPFPGGRKGLDGYASSLYGILINDIESYLKDEYGICIEKTTPPNSPSDYNEVDVTFVRANGVNDAQGKVRATYDMSMYPMYYPTPFTYLHMITHIGSGWSGIDNLLGVNPFTIKLKTVDC